MSLRKTNNNEKLVLGVENKTSSVLREGGIRAFFTNYLLIIEGAGNTTV